MSGRKIMMLTVLKLTIVDLILASQNHSLKSWVKLIAKANAKVSVKKRLHILSTKGSSKTTSAMVSVVLFTAASTT